MQNNLASPQAIRKDHRVSCKWCCVLHLLWVDTILCRWIDGYISTTTITANVLWPFVQDYPGELVPEETFAWHLLLGFIVQGKITEAGAPTIRLGATPSRLISDPPPSSPYFYAGCPSCCNPRNLSCLVIGFNWTTQRHTKQQISLIGV